MISCIKLLTGPNTEVLHTVAPYPKIYNFKYLRSPLKFLK